MKSTIEQNEIATLDSSLHDRIIESIYAGRSELDVYDFSEGNLNRREALELYHDGMIVVQLYDGTFIRVELERNFVVNLSTLHKEIHRYIANIEICQEQLFRCIEYTKSIFENYYAGLIDSLVETERSTFYHAFSKNGMAGLKNYTIRVNPTDVTTFASGNYGVVVRKKIFMLSMEQRIALSDILISHLNMSAYRRSHIELRYVRDSSTTIKFQMIWFRRNEKKHER